MRTTWLHRKNLLLGKNPTVGNLMELCEESYCYLLRIVPELAEMRGCYRSVRVDDMDLHLEVLEQSPYTTLVHLTYYFQHAGREEPEPDALLRAYHDARQVDVVNVKQQALPSERSFQAPSLENRWRLNLFANRWLAFCVIQGHKFEMAIESPRRKNLIARA